MRRLFCLLIFAAACGGTGSDSTNGTGPTPTPVAQLLISAQITSLGVGQQTTLSASTLDASGAPLTGRTVVWTTGTPSVATVSSTGVVTGVAGGQSIITATSETKTAQVTITVTAVAGACAAGTSLALQVGDVHLLTAAERTQLCVAGGVSGSEYALIPFNNDTTASLVLVSFSAANTVAIQAPVNASVASHGGALFHAYLQDEAFEARRMTQSRALFGPSLRSRRRAPALAASQLAPTGRLGINGLAPNPTVGTLVTLNANGNDACTIPLNRTGQVMAVTAHSIVLADTSSPAGGYTAADFASLAATFDTLVFPLDTLNFGAPTDIDDNGRIVLFFTSAVNQLTPAGSSSYIGGYFFNRDLFPAAPPTNGLFQCNTSNVGEMFYLPVVDASRLYNAFFDDKNTLIKQTVATLAHEFQHLISASRRIYINNSDDFETVWLDEGMSHIAEELLYLRIAGFAPKSNLTYPTITASQTLLDDVNFYQIQNFIRFQKFLSAPETHSAYSNDDSLPTRGATWNLLRYLLDQSSGAPNTYTRAIDNQVGNGIPSLNTVFSGVAPSLAVSLRQVAVALFTDDAGFAVTAPYTFPSWNYRSVMPNVPTAFAFSLQTRPLLPGSSQSFTLRGGASSYLRFRVNGNITGSVTPGQGVANSVDLILVRTQ